ncbi:hypothetical protein BJ944DRAFT_248504 [Cunninghamella echinulata]|nr:hypothetical protein BJ944DRAFT_248504 [Cunninghamella echinulata]
MVSYTYISLFLFCFCLLSKAENTLSVYHKRGKDYLKRGEITGIPHSPKYEPVEQGEGTLTLDLYQVKIKNDATGQITLQSIPSCRLLASDFKDRFIIHLDDNQQVYHVDYYAEGSGCKPVEEAILTNAFESNVEVAKVVDGPRPVFGQFNVNKKAGSKPIKQQGEDKEGDENEEELEEKTFFQKYWYLILAGGFMLLSNTVAPPPEQGQQQQQGRQ